MPNSIWILHISKIRKIWTMKARHGRYENDDPRSRIPELMDAAKVPGLSMLLMRNGSEELTTFGVRRGDSRQPVNAQTVFQAASLTKPVVAHATLQLVNARKLNLDEPLAKLIGRLVPDDEASASITARHVLCHATGLPNWRSSELPLRSYFTPGSRFSYSGEGFVYLQSALEHLTGEPLDELVQRLVLDPLGMDGSSLVWRAGFAKNIASPHDGEGKSRPGYQPDQANAAYSLHTTASDYGRFLAASLRGDLLTQASARLWMTPHVNVPKKRSEALENDPQNIETDVAWGLGWGLEPGSGSFFHWGANPGSTAFVLGIPSEQAGLVVFMNGNEGLRIVPHIIEGARLGRHPALSWLDLPEATVAA